MAGYTLEPIGWWDIPWCQSDGGGIYLGANRMVGYILEPIKWRDIPWSQSDGGIYLGSNRIV